MSTALQTLAVYVELSAIDLTPPKGVREAAARGLQMRRDAKPSARGGITPKEASKQGIGSGVSRAVSLKSGNKVSPDTIRRMCAFFSRHEKNKNTPKGKIAWLLWGGEPGRRWAESMRKRLDAETASVKISAGVTYDAVRGLGNVPFNQEIDYRGFTVAMPARVFLKLAKHRSFSDESNVDYIEQHIRDGKAIGYPFLEVTFGKKGARVTGHEGRTRAEAISRIYGNTHPVMVQVFVSPGRAKDLKIEQIESLRAGCTSQEGHAVTGPLFQPKFKWLGQVRDLLAETVETVAN